MPNRLIDEKSPYLLQHANNPVAWFPWCEEAFALAEREDKPIFLSIGYSTCHWCHVMEHESFEDEDVANLLNDGFVSIKVDREERPDIDSIYMNVCQMLTGSGGWPLTVMMTPAKEPFFAGTYFPKESRMGRIGMLELIPRVANIWNSNRSEIEQSVERIRTAVGKLSEKRDGMVLDKNILDRAFEQLKSEFDSDFGGFGTAPKFPTPHRLTFLLHYALRQQNDEAIRMVTETLHHMGRGGIFDHLGGGFHRYSTDRQWLLSHFEKMLYDQALLVLAFTEAFQFTGHAEFESKVRSVLSYVLRDMTSEHGGFYSAEDADSEGEEGTFYVWTENEIHDVLGVNEGEEFSRKYGVVDEGNFLEEATQERTGKNILNLISTGSEVQSDQYAEAREKLFEKRELRVRPYKDDKVLTDWNGLMIAAMARAGRVFNDASYVDAARSAWNFISENMISESGGLVHRYRDGEAAIDAHLDDYAFLIWGLIELYEATFQPQYLSDAIKLQHQALKMFGDDENGGFFFVDENNDDVLVRLKESYDGALPSGNSVMMLNLLKIGRMTGKVEWEEDAWKIAGFFSDMISHVPASHSQMLNAIDFALNETFEIVVVGSSEDQDTLSMLDSLKRAFLPHVVSLFVDAAKPDEMLKIASFLRDYKLVDGKATAYVCKSYACELPLTDVDEFKLRLEDICHTGFAK